MKPFVAAGLYMLLVAVIVPHLNRFFGWQDLPQTLIGYAIAMGSAFFTGWVLAPRFEKP